MDEHPLPTMREMRWLLVNEAMRRTRGNKLKAARLLGVAFKTIYNVLADGCVTSAPERGIIIFDTRPSTAGAPADEPISSWVI